MIDEFYPTQTFMTVIKKSRNIFYNTAINDTPVITYSMNYDCISVVRSCAAL
jgi:hypothetical protein